MGIDVTGPLWGLNGKIHKSLRGMLRTNQIQIRIIKPRQTMSISKGLYWQLHMTTRILWLERQVGYTLWLLIGWGVRTWRCFFQSQTASFCQVVHFICYDKLFHGIAITSMKVMPDANVLWMSHQELQKISLKPLITSKFRGTHFSVN